MPQRALLHVTAVWLALVGLLGMHVVAASGLAAPAVAPAATHAQPAATDATTGPLRAAAALPGTLLETAGDTAGTPADAGMVHAALACLVLLLVVVVLRRHRPGRQDQPCPAARAPATGPGLDSSRLSAALRWRTDPVRQAVLLT